jgi:hypothetical protein
MSLKGSFCSHHDAFHNYVFYFNAKEREIHCKEGKSPPSVAYICLKLAHLYHTSQRRSWQKWFVFIRPLTNQVLEVLLLWVGEWESGSPTVLASTLAGGFSVSVQYSGRVSSLLDHFGRQQSTPQLRGHQYVSRPLAVVSGAFLMTSHTLSVRSFYLVANASCVVLCSSHNEVGLEQHPCQTHSRTLPELPEKMLTLLSGIQAACHKFAFQRFSIPRRYPIHWQMVRSSVPLRKGSSSFPMTHSTVSILLFLFLWPSRSWGLRISLTSGTV